MEVGLDGEEHFHRLYGDLEEHNYGNSVGNPSLLTNDGTLILLIQYMNDSMETSPMMVAFDSLGDTLWTRKYNIGKAFLADNIIQPVGSSDFMICGTVRLLPGIIGPLQACAMRTDSIGEVIWYEEYGEEEIVEYATSIIENEEGGYFISGARIDTTGTNNVDGYLMKIDSQGQLVWQDHFGHSTLGETFHFLANTSDGNYLLAGTEVLGGVEDFEDREFRLRKFDIDGNIIWETFGGTGTSPRNGYAQVKEDVNGHYVCAGATNDNEFPTLRRGCLSKYEPDTGEQLWFHKYTYVEGWDPVSDHRLRDFDVLPDGGYVMAGWVYQSQFQDMNSQDIWLMRVDSDGCLEPGCLTVGINEQVAGLQEVMRVYPNPVPSGQEVILRFEEVLGARMPYSKQDTELRLIDASGREVFRELLPQQNGNGSFSYPLAVPSLASGSYTLHWLAEGSWYDSVQLIVE